MDTLRDIHESVAERIEENISMLAYGLSATRIGQVFEDTAELFQARAIGHLLLYFDREAFRRDLVRSGYARRYYLARCRAEGANGVVHQAISRTEAFLSALVSRHEELAAELAAEPSIGWVANGEYEDDYCYFAFLHHIALDPNRASTERAETLLASFEEALEGTSSPRLAVCQALRHAEGFDEAFAALLTDHERWADEHRDVRAFDPVFRMRSRLFVEGLALLAVAERAGLPTQHEYQFCPSVARLEPAGQWPPDPFVEVERIAREERRKREQKRKH